MLGSNNGEEKSGTRPGEKRAGTILSEFILGSATNGLASPVSSTSLTTGHVDLQLFGDPDCGGYLRVVEEGNQSTVVQCDCGKTNWNLVEKKN